MQAYCVTPSNYWGLGGEAPYNTTPRGVKVDKPALLVGAWGLQPPITLKYKQRKKFHKHYGAQHPLYCKNFLEKKIISFLKEK